MRIMQGSGLSREGFRCTQGTHAHIQDLALPTAKVEVEMHGMRGLRMICPAGHAADIMSKLPLTLLM